MARKKKRLGRLPLDRLPYFMRKPRPGPARRKDLDRSMPMPKGPPLGVQPKGPQQHVQPKGPQQHAQPKGPQRHAQPEARLLDVQPKGPPPDVQPKGLPPDRVRPDRVSKITTIVCWDLAPDVDYYHVRNLLKDINGVLDISCSSTRHCAVVHFATAIDAQMALYQLTGCCLKGHPLKFAWFDKNSYDPNRDTLPVMELVPGRVTHTIYVEGFDSSLGITQIRSLLKFHFGLSRLHGGRIITPRNRDGSSTGKAFVRFQSNTDFFAALERNGLDLGDGCKLRVARWPELLSFPWHHEKNEGGIFGGLGGHVNAANWGTPSTGKRIVFEI